MFIYFCKDIKILLLFRLTKANFPAPCQQSNTECCSRYSWVVSSGWLSPTGFLNIIFTIGGVLELYRSACHFISCKSSVDPLLQPWGARKLKDKDIKYRVIVSSCPRLRSSSMYETAYQNPQNYTQLQQTENTGASCPFRSVWFRSGKDYKTLGAGIHCPF